jgi:hypothetical protein
MPLLLCVFYGKDSVELAPGLLPVARMTSALPHRFFGTRVNGKKLAWEGQF